MIEIINSYIKTTTAAAIITIVTTTMGQNICDSCLCCCDNRQKTTTATIKNDQTMIALVQLSVDIMWKKWEEISFQSNYTLTRAIIIITRGRPQQQKQQQHHTCVYLDLKERNKTNIEQQFIINVIGTIKQMIMMKKKQQQQKLKRESLLSAELEKEELCLTAGDWIAWRCSGW